MPCDSCAAPFTSILAPADGGPFASVQPTYFVDLNLHQVIGAVVPGVDADVLLSVFWSPTRDEATVRFRQAVFADLERPALLAPVAPFRDAMRFVRAGIVYAAKVERAAHRDAVMLRAAGRYCGAMLALATAWRAAGPRSAGLLACLGYLEEMMAGADFAALTDGAARCRASLATVRYGLLFRGDSVLIRRHAGEPDTTDTVHDRFARFRETDSPAPRPKAAPEGGGLDHIEAGILSSVSCPFRAPFAEVAHFVGAHPDFIDPLVARLHREIVNCSLSLDRSVGPLPACLNCSPSLDRSVGPLPACRGQVGPCVPDRSTSVIGGLLPIALCGRTSL